MKAERRASLKEALEGDGWREAIALIERDDDPDAATLLLEVLTSPHTRELEVRRAAFDLLAEGAASWLDQILMRLKEQPNSDVAEMLGIRAGLQEDQASRITTSLLEMGAHGLSSGRCEYAVDALLGIAAGWPATSSPRALRFAKQCVTLELADDRRLLESSLDVIALADATLPRTIAAGFACGSRQRERADAWLALREGATVLARHLSHSRQRLN